MLNYKYKLIDICINRYEFQVVDNYNNGTIKNNFQKNESYFSYLQQNYFQRKASQQKVDLQTRVNP